MSLGRRLRLDLLSTSRAGGSAANNGKKTNACPAIIALEVGNGCSFWASSRGHEWPAAPRAPCLSTNGCLNPYSRFASRAMMTKKNFRLHRLSLRF